MTNEPQKRAKLTPEEKIERKRIAKAKWQRENRETHRAHLRRWREKESTRSLETALHRRWRAANRERDNLNKLTWRRANPEKVRLYARRVGLKKKYGLSIDQLNEMFVAQGSCCAVCRSTSPGCKSGWMVDHCHETNVVRGILCNHCNRMLHKFATPHVLRAGIAYLERFQARAAE